MKRKIGILFGIISGLFLANVALAEDWSQLLKGLTFTPHSTDLSIKYLIEMFGRIQGINLFAGQGTSILSVIFGVFNAGLLAISGVFLAYTFVKVLTNTTIDGSAMGKSATVWMAVRCALSTTLLVPQSTGYSTINAIIMWIIVQSIGFANVLWNHSVDYIYSHGNQSFVFEKSNESAAQGNQVNYSLINGEKDSVFTKFDSNKHVSSKDMLASLVCAYSVLGELNAKRQNQYDIQLNEYETASDDAAKRLAESKMLSLSQTILNNQEQGFSVYKFNVIDDESGSIQFPYVHNDLFYQNYGFSNGDISTGICGKFSYNTAVQKNAALQMLNVLNGAARRIVDNVSNDSSLLSNTTIGDVALEDVTLSSPDLETVGTGSLPEGTLNLVSAALNYQEATRSVWLKTNQKNDSDEDYSIDKIKDLGWLFAGSFYYYLMNMNAQTSVDDSNVYLNVSSKYSPTNVKIGKTWTKNLSNAELWVTKAGILAYNYANYTNNVILSGEDAAIDKAAGQIKEGLDQIKSVSNATLTGYLTGAGVLMAVPLYGPLAMMATFRGIPMMILHVAANNFIDTWSSELKTKKDAIFKVQKIGESLISEAMFIFNKILLLNVSVGAGGVVATALTVASKSVAAVGTYWASTSGVVSTLETMESFSNQVISIVSEILLLTMPIVLCIAVPMLTSGLLMAIYLPLLPVILFLFGGMSWFISVLVLMFAAPLICFLMLWGANSQENLLLTKEAEQFVMQIIAIFFRPVLMVAGLLLGIFIFNIGVSFLNEVFAQVYELVVGDNSSLASVSFGANYSFNVIVAMFKVIGVVVIYTFALFGIANLAYSCIYTLYSEVMRIIGVSAPAIGLEEQYVETVKGGMSKGNESFGQGASNMTSASKGFRANVGKFQYNMKDDEDKKGNASITKEDNKNDGSAKKD